MRGLSLVVASGGHSSSRCAGLSLSRPLVAEHRLQTRRLSSCGSRAQALCGMWDPPRPGLEPVSPALAGRFSTTAPPGKPPYFYFDTQIVLGQPVAAISTWILCPLMFPQNSLCISLVFDTARYTKSCCISPPQPCYQLFPK